MTSSRGQQQCAQLVTSQKEGGRNAVEYMQSAARKTQLRILHSGVPQWLSRLRIQRYHCCGRGSIRALATSSCCKKKKNNNNNNNTKQKKTNPIIKELCVQQNCPSEMKVKQRHSQIIKTKTKIIHG